MATRILRSLFQTLGLVARGRFEEKLNAEMARAIEALEQHPDDKCEAVITIKVKVTKLADRIDIKPAVELKLPAEKGFPATTFWPAEGGLSVQHPSQVDMFGGPAAVEPRREATPA